MESNSSTQHREEFVVQMKWFIAIIGQYVEKESPLVNAWVVSPAL
jgi:hypothetical protein